MAEGHQSETFVSCSPTLLPKTSQKQPERLLQVEDIRETPVPQQNLKYWRRFLETEKVIMFCQYLEEIRENLQVIAACILDIPFIVNYLVENDKMSISLMPLNRTRMAKILQRNLILDWIQRHQKSERNFIYSSIIKMWI